MSTRVLGVDWIFGWLEARSASAHCLLSEAIAFTHEHDVGLDREARRTLLAHLGEAETLCASAHVPRTSPPDGDALANA